MTAVDIRHDVLNRHITLAFFLFFIFFTVYNTHASGLVKCILPKFCNCSIKSTFCKMELWFAFTNLHLQWKSDTVQHFKCLENWLYCQQSHAKMYKGFWRFVQNKQWAWGSLWLQLFSIVSSIPKTPFISHVVEQSFVDMKISISAALIHFN